MGTPNYASVEDTNFTNLTATEIPYGAVTEISPMWIYRLLGVCIVIFGIFGTVGNLIVIVIFIRHRALRTSSNSFVFTLALSDLLMCLVNFPLFAYSNASGSWPGAPASCQLTGFVGSFTSYTSINTLTAMAVDRYIVIKKTRLFQRNTFRANLVAIAIVWIYSALWALFPLIGWGSYVVFGRTSCTFDFQSTYHNNVSFIICIYTFCFTIQLILICSCYISIFITVYYHNKEMYRSDVIGAESLQRGAVCRRQLEFKIARLVFIIVFVFCVSWAPYATLALIHMFGNPQNVTPLAVALAGVLAKSSTVINPFIYAISHPRFKACIRMYWHFKKKKIPLSTFNIGYTSTRRFNSNSTPRDET